MKNEIELLDGDFLENKFNYLKDLAEHNNKSLDHVLVLIDNLAKYYRTVYTHLAHLIYSKLDSEFVFNVDGLDKYVWSIISTEDTNSSIVSLKVFRTEITKEEDESNNSSSGIE